LCFEANDSGDCTYDFYLVILAEVVYSCSGFDVIDVARYVNDNALFTRIFKTMQPRKAEIQQDVQESIRLLPNTIEQLISRYNSTSISRELFASI